MTGPHSNDSTPRPDGPDAARDAHSEPLSAMMDGTLSDDESRFLLRRMQHDAELAGRWERWQFYGDAMRGCAGRALPADFNRRITLAIAAECHAAAGEADGAADHDHIALDAVAGDPRGRVPVSPQPAAVAVRRPLLRWGGGAALAASVAFAAIVGLRPGASVAPEGVSPAPGAALVDAAPAKTAAGSSSTPVPAPPSASSEPAPVLGASTAATATTAATMRGDDIPGTAQADAVRTSSASTPAALASAPQSAVEQAPRPIQAGTTDYRTAASAPRVFAAQSVEVGAAPRVPDLRAGFGSDVPGDEVLPIAKPWPRAPLLQGRIDGGVMVDYGQGGDGRGLIPGRQAQPPRSVSPLSSPSIFATPAGASASEQGSAASPSAGADDAPL